MHVSSKPDFWIIIGNPSSPTSVSLEDLLQLFLPDIPVITMTRISGRKLLQATGEASSPCARPSLTSDFRGTHCVDSNPGIHKFIPPYPTRSPAKLWRLGALVSLQGMVGWRRVRLQCMPANLPCDH